MTKVFNSIILRRMDMHLLSIRCRSYGEEFTEYDGDLEYMKTIFHRLLAQGRFAGAGSENQAKIPLIQDINDSETLLQALNDASFNLKLGIDYELFEKFMTDNPDMENRV
jgi:hypothetical protein